MLRAHMPEDKMVVFHDGFRFDAWFDFFANHDFKNVILDAHWYLGMTPGGALGDCDLTYLQKVLRDHAYNLEQMEKVVPVVVGNGVCPTICPRV